MWLAPLLVVAASALGEAMHARRVRRVSALLFGPGARPRAWTRAAPVLRCAAAGALAWGLLTLFSFDGGAGAAPGKSDPVRRLVVCLDVSPSMTLADAGADGKQARAARAADIVRSILERLDNTRTKISVVAFYTGAKPVVIDATDMGIVTNILDDLPLEYAFVPGPTNVYDGVREAFAIARTWPAGSAALLLVSDGDTLPETGLPTKPPSIADVLIVGVGSARQGKPIAGRTSRQDAASLDRLALRLGGAYHDGNTRGVPSNVLAGLSLRAPPGKREGWERTAALACIGAGAAALSLLPPALALWGSPRRRARIEQTVEPKPARSRERAPLDRAGVMA